MAIEKKSKYDLDGSDSKMGAITEREFDEAVSPKGIVSKKPTKTQDKYNGVDRILTYPLIIDKTDYIQIKSQGACDDDLYCIPIGLKMGNDVVNRGIFDERWDANLFAFERASYNEFVVIRTKKLREFIREKYDIRRQTSYKESSQKHRKVYIRVLGRKKDFLVYLSQKDFEDIGIEGVYHKNNDRPSGINSVEELPSWLDHRNVENL